MTNLPKNVVICISSFLSNSASVFSFQLVSKYVYEIVNKTPSNALFILTTAKESLEKKEFSPKYYHTCRMVQTLIITNHAVPKKPKGSETKDKYQALESSSEEDFSDSPSGNESDTDEMFFSDGNKGTGMDRFVNLILLTHVSFPNLKEVRITEKPYYKRKELDLTNLDNFTFDLDNEKKQWYLHYSPLLRLILGNVKKVFYSFKKRFKLDLGYLSPNIQSFEVVGECENKKQFKRDQDYRLFHLKKITEITKLKLPIICELRNLKQMENLQELAFKFQGNLKSQLHLKRATKDQQGFFTHFPVLKKLEILGGFNFAYVSDYKFEQKSLPMLKEIVIHSGLGKLNGTFIPMERSEMIEELKREDNDEKKGEKNEIKINIPPKKEEIHLDIENDEKEVISSNLTPLSSLPTPSIDVDNFCYKHEFEERDEKEPLNFHFNDGVDVVETVDSIEGEGEEEDTATDTTSGITSSTEEVESKEDESILDYPPLEKRYFLSDFTSVQNVTLKRCNGIDVINIRDMGNIPNITINHCEELRKIVDGYSDKLRNLAIINCHNFSFGMSDISGFESFTMKGVIKDSSVRAHCGLKTLVVTRTNIYSFWGLSDVNTLEINCARKLERIEGLESCKVLRVRKARVLREIDLSKNGEFLEVLELKLCPKLIIPELSIYVHPANKKWTKICKRKCRRDISKSMRNMVGNVMARVERETGPKKEVHEIVSKIYDNICERNEKDEVSETFNEVKRNIVKRVVFNLNPVRSYIKEEVKSMEKNIQDRCRPMTKETTRKKKRSKKFWRDCLKFGELALMKQNQKWGKNISHLTIEKCRNIFLSDEWSFFKNLRKLQIVNLNLMKNMRGLYFPKIEEIVFEQSRGLVLPGNFFDFESNSNLVQVKVKNIFLGEFNEKEKKSMEKSNVHFENEITDRSKFTGEIPNIQEKYGIKSFMICKTD